MMHLFNSLTGKKEQFEPLDKKTVKIYTCGPTVYDFAHIGNLRAFVFDDVLIRSLLLFGYKVEHVINITDIGHLVGDADEGEDKMMKALNREGLPPTVASLHVLAEKYTEAFWKDCALLNLFQMQHPNYTITWTKATEYVPQMITLTEQLLLKGNAYETPSAIYFDVSTFPEYTKLSHQPLADKLVGVREGVAVDPEKRHAADFALWFKLEGKHKNHVMHWPSPWGDGFPGWHIECSAMAMEELGSTLDIHCGGIDHIPVHHTNEIAQSEAVTGKPFSRFWMHNEFLDFNNAKMSKSAGTFITLNDVIEKGYPALSYRYLCMGTHYRQKLNFSWEALTGAQQGLKNLKQAVQQMEGKNAAHEKITKSIAGFKEALSDDINVPKALAAVWELVKDSTIDRDERLAAIELFDTVLGLELTAAAEAAEEAPEEIKALAAARDEARVEKNFTRADELRASLEKSGWNVEDTPNGPKLIKK